MPTSPAVFVSYASQDAEAARRICNALRAAGIEVWFDQNELVGGDAWDAKIRRQIKECALFVPVISENTNARAEGYFRLEWLLAVERSRLMADDQPFLLPVVIDGTADANARVPDRFREVQWTRLPAGETAAAFVGRVQRLLTVEATPAPRPAPTTAPAKPSVSSSTPRLPRWVWMGASVLALAAIAIFLLNRPARPAGIADKSIAILPFANLSPDKENEFFTAGVHEDILTKVQSIRDLRVVSRTSVLQYRETTKTMPQIGRELGVTYLLEGSVRRVGNTVRVTGQLIRAANDEHVWAKTFDRNLTDVFAIQAELAHAIATELDAALSPREQKLISDRPTNKTEAYDLLLKAREAVRSAANTREDHFRRESLLLSALKLDDGFAPAWALLVEAHAGMISGSIDTTPARRAKAQAALERAVALAPDSPATVRAQGVYFLFGLQEPAQAYVHFSRLVTLQPNDADSHAWLGVAAMFGGKWPEGLAAQRRAAQLDSTSVLTSLQLADTLGRLRRWPEALTEARRLAASVAVHPDPSDSRWSIGFLQYCVDGSTALLDEEHRRGAAAEENSPQAIDAKKSAALHRRDFQEYLRLDRLYPETGSRGTFSTSVMGALVAARVHHRLGQAEQARARLGNLPTTLRAQLELEPNNTQVLRSLAMVEAILGHKEEALHAIGQAIKLVPMSANALLATQIASVQIDVLLTLGEHDLAITEIERLLRIPSYLSVPFLRISNRYDALRGNPRFEALLIDPKNNAPLF